MARSIDGRSEDLIYLENRQGRLVPVHPILFAQSLEALPEVREDQVVQEPGRLLVRLALRSESVAERVEEKVRARFKEGLGGQENRVPAAGLRVRGQVRARPERQCEVQVRRFESEESPAG